MAYTLITGASSGIGKELARLFAADGFQLVLVARREDLLEQLAEELNRQYKTESVIIQADLALHDAASKVFQEITSRSIKVMYLVNNAGFYVKGFFTSTDWDTEARLIQIQCLSHTLLTKLLLPGMINEGEGGILNVGSTGSFVTAPYHAIYCASKAFVLSFSEALAEELKGTGVKVTALCPGGTDTEFYRKIKRKASNLLPLLEPSKVAREGYDALMQGRFIAVPGAVNKLQVTAARFLPRWFITRLAASVVNHTS